MKRYSYPSLFAGVFALLAIFASSATARAETGERYAFLVGVQEYNEAELNSLRYPVSDVVSLAETLGTVGYPPENVTLMSQKDGTRARYLPLRKNILDELTKLLNILHPNDTIIVAFAGHGVQFKGEKQAFFCPMDAKLKDRETLVPLEAVYSALEKCKAGTKVLLVDACRNDPQAALSRTTARIELESVGRPQPTPPAGVLAVYSCSDGELAYEHPDLAHGVFFYHVIEALKGAGDADGDKEVTLDEIKAYATRRVQKYVLQKIGENQTPMVKGELRGAPTLAVLGGATVARPMLVTPEPMPMPAPSRAKIEGTTWLVVAGNQIKSLVTFRPDGTLVQDKGDGKPRLDKWKWVQDRIALELDAGEYTLEGHMAGNRMDGKGGNRAGQGFAWSGMLEKSAPAGDAGPPLPEVERESPEFQASILRGRIAEDRRRLAELTVERGKLSAAIGNYSKDDKEYQEFDARLTKNQMEIESIRRELQERESKLIELEVLLKELELKKE